MKLKILIATIFSILNGYSQELSINETIDYLNSKIGKESGELSLKQGGELTFKKYSTDYWFDRNNLSFEEMNKRKKNNNYKMILWKTTSFSIHNIHIDNIGFINSTPSYFHTQISCTGCLRETEFDKYGEQISTKNISKLDILSDFQDTNDKIYNALRYLISIAKNDSKYQNIDNDPFSSKNFQNNFNIISTNTKSNKIQLMSENGIYKISVDISGIKKNFVLDSGASELSISQSLENELISKNLIQKTDYLEPALYKIADGSILSCRRVKLKQVKVGNVIVKNVIASIGISETPLLLGKTFLDNFQKWSIDNKSKLLTLEN
jgi:clan AA aspartic protease (TIGR02281 family)